MTIPALNPTQRARDLEAVTDETFDILVIGGGVTGAGAALDAATRGLSVAIVEAQDWASGTSSRSSRLITAACATSTTLTSPSWPRPSPSAVAC